MEAQNLFANSRVNIRAERKRHLGAVIGSTKHRGEYVKDLVKDRENQLTILSTIAETQQQAAYSAFASGFKLNYFLRTIPNTRHILLPLERTIRNKFIQAVADATYAVTRMYLCVYVCILSFCFGLRVALQNLQSN